MLHKYVNSIVMTNTILGRFRLLTFYVFGWLLCSSSPRDSIKILSFLWLTAPGNEQVSQYNWSKMTSALFTTAVAIGNAIGASNKREIVDNLPISFHIEIKWQTLTTRLNTFSDNTFLQNDAAAAAAIKMSLIVLKLQTAIGVSSLFTCPNHFLFFMPTCFLIHLLILSTK